MIPFIAYLALIGGTALDRPRRSNVISSLLMIAVTTVVGLGQQRFINILRRSTGLIKAIGLG